MFRALKQDIIVIHSEKIAKDLLERRSNIYSSRPHLASKEPYVIISFKSENTALLDLAGNGAKFR